jgi:hypothetical protein
MLESRVPCNERFCHSLSGFLQPGQMVVHLSEQTLACGADRLARRPTALTRFEETRQLFRREPEADGVSDEQQTRNGIVGVVAKAASRSRCRWQHANALVIADEIRADASTVRSLTDSERPSWHTPSYNLESFQIQDQVLA